MTPRTRIRSAAAISIAAGALALGLSGCAVSPTGDTHWETHREMRASSEGDLVPTLVQSDATDIDLRSSQITSTGTQLRWNSAKEITRDDCEAGPISGTSRAGASWWPADVPDEGWSCGWWTVFEQDGTFYAWHDSTTDGSADE